MKPYLIALCIFALAIKAQADLITFSVTGTANSTSLGYVSGESYTFHWVLDSSYNEPGSFSATENFWGEFVAEDDNLYLSLSGDGLTGTLTRPTDPWSSVFTGIYSGQQELWTWTATDSGNDLGLTVDGKNLSMLYAQVRVADMFDFTQTPMTPSAYFASYGGTYAALSGGEIFLRVANNEELYFTPSSVTITVVPEPGTLGLLSLGGLTLLLRRRRAAI